MHHSSCALQAVAEVRKRFRKGLPELDPETDMAVDDSGFRKAQRKMETLEGGLAKHPLASNPSLQPRLLLLRQKQVLPAQLTLAALPWVELRGRDP